jgi:hypothetical protein
MSDVASLRLKVEGSVERYLDLMESQREEIFQKLAGITNDRLWQRPAPGEWSMGENLDHTRVLLRSVRRLFTVVWPLLNPIGRLRKGKPYETMIEDVYERPDFPMSMGWLWPPYYKAERPVSWARLHQELAEEHQRIRRWYESRDEAVLGHAHLYDPVIGWLNLVQALRVGVYHDALHFRAVANRYEGRQ